MRLIIFFFFKGAATTIFYTYLHTLYLRDALPIFARGVLVVRCWLLIAHAILLNRLKEWRGSAAPDSPGGDSCQVKRSFTKRTFPRGERSGEFRLPRRGATPEAPAATRRQAWMESGRGAASGRAAA